MCERETFYRDMNFLSLIIKLRECEINKVYIKHTGARACLLHLRWSDCQEGSQRAHILSETKLLAGVFVSFVVVCACVPARDGDGFCQ